MVDVGVQNGANKYLMQVFFVFLGEGRGGAQREHHPKSTPQYSDLSAKVRTLERIAVAASPFWTEYPEGRAEWHTKTRRYMRPLAWALDHEATSHRLMEISLNPIS